MLCTVNLQKNKLARSLRFLLLLVGGLLLPLAAAQPEDDVASFRQAVAAEPDSAAAWADLGTALLGEEETAEARDAFLEALALDYRNGDAHFGLGLSEYRLGDYQSALFSFGELARLEPERFDGHYNRAVTFARLRMPEEAAEAFADALENAEPGASLADEFNAWLGLAGQRKLTGDYADAAEAYASALEIEPGDRDVRYLHAEALWKADDGLEALPLLTELDDADNADHRVNSLIADIYMDEGQTDYAVRALERAIRKARDAGNATAEAGLHIKLGLLERRLGSDRAALASFEEAVKVDPAAWQGHYNLGLAHLEAGRTDQAVTPLETAVSRAPASGEARLALATAYDRTDDAEAALEQAEASLGLLTDAQLRAQADFLKGRSEYRLGDYEAAAASFDRVISERPGDGQAQLWAGLTEYQLGDYGSAVQYYERAVQLLPDSREARANLAAGYLASERYPDAEQAYGELLAEDPEDARSLYNLGWAQLSQNRRLEARDSFEAALELGWSAAADTLEQHF